MSRPINSSGDRVTTDLLAMPFSMGRNLLCIFSKKHVDNPPELKSTKQRRDLAARQPRGSREMAERRPRDSREMAKRQPRGGRETAQRQPRGSSRPGWHRARHATSPSPPCPRHNRILYYIILFIIIQAQPDGDEDDAAADDGRRKVHLGGAVGRQGPAERRRKVRGRAVRLKVD